MTRLILVLIILMLFSAPIFIINWDVDYEMSQEGSDNVENWSA